MATRTQSLATYQHKNLYETADDTIEFSNGAMYKLVSVFDYRNVGNGLWIHKALGIQGEAMSSQKLQYNSEFLNSDWKLFYDALQEHRFHIIHVILPKYGICVA